MSKNSNFGSCNFFDLLTILLIGLKLTGYISWSWWWVLAPLWMPLSVVLACAIIAFVALKVLERD